MAMEDFEFVRRKFGAGLMILVGLLISIGFLIPSYFHIIYGRIQEAIGSIIFSFFGLALLIYGGYVWSKVTHVVWTKQAIREMMDKQFEVDEDHRRFIKSKPIMQEKKCPKCNKTTNIKDEYCPECGNKFEDDQTINLCPHCKKELKQEDNYCSNCGQIILKD